MTDRPIKQPGPDHPITIEASRSRVVVSLAGKTVADTYDAVTLREAGYAAVHGLAPRPDSPFPGRQTAR